MTGPEYPHIALIGKMGAGKTTAADIVQELAGYRKLSFAGALRAVAVAIWGQDAYNDRDKLQQLGTKVRDIDPDAWLNLFSSQFEQRLPDTTRIVVDDCRFPNEFQRLKELGFVTVRVWAARDTRVGRLRANGKLTDEAQLEHVSETALDEFMTDHTVSNDPPTNLREQLVNILNQEAR